MRRRYGGRTGLLAQHLPQVQSQRLAQKSFIQHGPGLRSRPSPGQVFIGPRGSRDRGGPRRRAHRLGRGK